MFYIISRSHKIWLVKKVIMAHKIYILLIISDVSKPSMNSLCFAPLSLFSIFLWVFVFKYCNNHRIFSCVETLIYSADSLRVVVYNKLVKVFLTVSKSDPYMKPRWIKTDTVFEERRNVT